MFSWLTSLNGFLPAILKICYRHQVLDAYFFQYGMKIVQGNAAFFCRHSPIFAFKKGERPFFWRCFVF